MALFDIVEEALTDRQAAFLNHCVQPQQHLAERFHLRQVGHFRALSQRGELLQQRRKLLALGRMRSPATQQVLGVQQDIHTLGEE